MRACSRCVAGSRSACCVACVTGSETWRLSGVVLQAASNRATSAIAAPRALVAETVVSVAAVTALLLGSCSSIYKFDLLGGLGRDDRAAALFDPPAHTDAAAFKPLGLDARGRKATPQASQNGDGEVPRPTPPEVDIYSGPALAHRQDLAFNQREMTLFGL